MKNADPNGKDIFGNELPRWEPFSKKDEFLMLFADAPAKSPLRTDEKTKKLIEEKTGPGLEESLSPVNHASVRRSLLSGQNRNRCLSWSAG